MHRIILLLLAASLYLAAMNGREDVVRYLLEKGANPDAVLESVAATGKPSQPAAEMP